MPPRPCYDTLSPEVFRNSVREVCKLSVHNASHKLQNEFCDLWNHLVKAARHPGQEPVHLSYIMLILSFTRSIHVSLHECASSLRSSMSPTHIVDAFLQNPSSYPPCAISHSPVISVNQRTNISVDHDSGAS